MMDNDNDLSRIENELGHVFRDRSLLETALTHPSFAHEATQASDRDRDPRGNGHYERLEFLGDSILSLVLSDRIMRMFPDSPEGGLSRIRAGLVCADRLADLARGIGLGDALRLGKGEEATGGREKPSILADAFEAVIAAVFLDGGFETARQVILARFQPIFDNFPLIDLLGDYKTPLQEKVQAVHKVTPYYRVVNEEGPDHDKVFEVELIIKGQTISRGRGRSKKEAEQEAALKALQSGMLDE